MSISSHRKSGGFMGANVGMCRSTFILLLGLLGAVYAEVITVVPLQPCVGPSKVAIIKDAGQNVTQMVTDAVNDVLGPSGMAALVKTGDTVVIKPNLVAIGSCTVLGTMSDHRVAQAVVNLVKAAGASVVIIAEGSALNNTAAMRDSTGYTAANFPGVQFLDLNDYVNNRLDTLHLLNGCMGDDKQVLAAYIHAKVVIGIPIMKTHQGVGITGSLKNSFGMPPQPLVAYNGSANKQMLHADIRKNIIDYNLCRHPDFVVMDALTAQEGNGPTNGSPVTMNLILASKDPVALDAVECSIMEVPPYCNAPIVLAANVNLGLMEMSDITVVGESIAGVQHPFVRAQSEVGYYCYRAINAVRKVGTPVTIDGSLSEWAGRNRIYANTSAQVVGTVSKWTGPSSCSFTAKFLYDSLNLYMAVTVKDTGKVASSLTGQAIQNGEFVELYLSTATQFGVNLTNSANTRLTTYDSAHDYRIGFSHSSTPANWVFSHNRTLTNAVAKCVDNDTGYVLEAKIPWSNFNNFALSRYRELGINVAVGKATAISSTCDYRIFWSPDTAVDRDPTTMGLAYLTPMADDAPSAAVHPQSVQSRQTAESFAFIGARQVPGSHSVRIGYSVSGIRFGNASRMEIYSVKGGLVATLPGIPGANGTHEVLWNCKDGLGRSVSEGVYYCRLITGDDSRNAPPIDAAKPVAVFFRD